MSEGFVIKSSFSEYAGLHILTDYFERFQKCAIAWCCTWKIFEIITYFLPELITVIILISLKLSFVNRKYFRLYLFKVEGSYLASLTLTFRGGQGIEGRRQWKVLIQRTINLLAARPCPPSWNMLLWNIYWVTDR